jgi:hypothetical protein
MPWRFRNKSVNAKKNEELNTHGEASLREKQAGI